MDHDSVALCLRRRLHVLHLRIEESLRMQDSDKLKGNNVAGPSIVNMVEYNKSSRYTDNWDKRKHHADTKADPNKKSKVDDVVWAVVRLHDPKLKTLDKRGIEMASVCYIGHSKAFRFYVIEHNESVSINSTIESRDAIFDEKSLDQDDPKTFDEAIKSQDVTLWKEATNDGMDFIIGNNTWQTPKQWHQNSDEVVLSSVYLLNQDDKCVYSKFDESGKGVIICLYVNDILIFGTNQVHVDLTKKLLSSRFSMKGMGEADVILGIRIKHESNGISISQSHYTEKALKKFNYFDCTLVSTPIDTSEKVRPNNGQARVLKYLKKTMDYSLSYTRYHSVLEGYTDASWISNTEYNSSISGWVFLLKGGAISWASKKQTCITSSTMESEFVALTAAGKEAEWLKNLLFEISLWYKPITPISICCDSATTLSKPNVQWKV
ncbi:zinc finger, CCHC-type containing protein [Tanacetum coccineum]